MKMQCDMCGKHNAKIRKITKSFGKGSNIFIIENIPLIICPDCGESYYTADTLYEIERLKGNKKAHSQNRMIPVAEFS
ncbi:type II toxin-antitoxin system MqsA family antitoxin [candidate division CSSED10-310 bacterium]|uniref:Type II toxin-antitoxin system MqsA family antitoxin n=1 Tax=candidate division CSSED10-310 bacterium TaxID=2855610 RepID=A0ABV6Z344_UNCC1